MKITLQYKDLIYCGIIAILLWLCFRNTTPDVSPEIDKLKFQRDSIVQADVIKSQEAQKSFRHFADSCRDYVSYYEKADSINHYKIRHEKGKIKHLTPTERDHVRDSIYRANGVPTSPR